MLWWMGESTPPPAGLLALPCLQLSPSSVVTDGARRYTVLGTVGQGCFGGQAASGLACGSALWSGSGQVVYVQNVCGSAVGFLCASR